MSTVGTTVWPPPAYNGKVRFDVWETQLDMYLSERQITDKKAKSKAMLQVIGTEYLQKIIDWTSPTKPQDMEFDDLMAIVKDKLEKKPNYFALRVKFFNERQQPGQSLEDFIVHMSNLMLQCKLDKMSVDELGVLAILKGLSSDETRQFLMTSTADKSTVSKLQEIASCYEQGKATALEIKGKGNTSGNFFSMNVVGRGYKCKWCGEAHQPGKEKCPANGKKCKSCGKQNHFAKVCKSSRKQNQVEFEDSSDDEAPRSREGSTHGCLNGLYSVLTISSGPEADSPPMKVNAKLDGTTVYFQHDSGAAVSVISKKVWHQIGKPKIHPTDIELQSYTGKIPVIGQCEVVVQVGKLIKQQWIIVVPHGQSLFGRNWIKAFDGDLQRLCNQSKDLSHRDSTVYKQNTVMARPNSGRCNKLKVYKMNTVTAERVYDNRAPKNNDASCCCKKKSMLMHVPMQGKEKAVSGKDSNGWKADIWKEKYHSKFAESTVLKSLKLQYKKQSRTWKAKDVQDAVNQEDWRAVKGRKDHTSKSLKMKADEAVAEKNRESKEKRPKANELSRDTVAYTSRVEAYQSRGRLDAEIHKKDSYKSRGGVGYRSVF